MSMAEAILYACSYQRLGYRHVLPTLALRRSLPNMSFNRGTGDFSPSTLSHSRRQSPATMRSTIRLPHFSHYRATVSLI